ncbi:DNA-binding response regulator, OmpR family, contains REC and winged-helix (wHTH) domain [Anaerobranca californiensis DSM 14826]|jgi:DNA-binding response OmpR family regulator|uniref:Stage 0 sporulation protein A homolog n=1 Tax=Anaerobranca californiensis DSM 14826 TaxID=1120989 RepID=A0A1M6P481_9FIRM|nr:response regulator transcription factor [Anaerobranca californiensis]SHK02777.1 DNA-binding response regulator, OmpR family, contains REC and winged-helix (wHTH) domain [Anaerobranca californiensis DSM 14826]
MTERILIIDDEELLVKGLSHSLMKEGFLVDSAFDGEEGLSKFKEKGYSLIILDLMLPKIDGMSLCKEIRKESAIPIIMLTAKGDDVDKILGLEYGADDYLTKPFNTKELIARIKAVLRRTGKKIGNVMEFGELKIVLNNRQVFHRGENIELTAKEFDILALLATHPGKIYTRENLLDLIWGYEYYGDVRTVDVHVRRIREKIEDNPSEPQYIITKWGVGYFFGGPENVY